MPMPICQHCGTGLPVGHNFCHECGRSVGADATPVVDSYGEPAAASPTPLPGPPPATPPSDPAGGRQAAPGAWGAPWPGSQASRQTPPPMPSPSPASLKSEGIWTRVLASLIDLTLAFAVFVVFLVVWMLVTNDPDLGERLQNDESGNLGILVGLLLMLTWYVYAVILEAVTGTTLGKRIVGLKVVMDDGRRCSWAGSLVRNIFKFFTFTSGWALIITLVAILADGRNRRVGDMAARTFVVKKGVIAGVQARGIGPAGPAGWGGPPPPPGFGPPPPGFMPPPPGFMPPPGYGPPPPGYGPPPGWGGPPSAQPPGPPPGWGSPPPGQPPTAPRGEPSGPPPASPAEPPKPPDDPPPSPTAGGTA